MSRKRCKTLLMGILCATLCGGCQDDFGGEPAAGQRPTVDRFTRIDDGMIKDTRTDLQWTRRDNDRNLTWHEADRYCQELRLGGMKGWRLPEIDELKGLYDERLQQPCGERTCHLTPLIALTAPYVWSGTQRGPSRYVYFDFRVGSSLAPRLKPGLYRHVLCVRK